MSNETKLTAVQSYRLGALQLFSNFISGKIDDNQWILLEEKLYDECKEMEREQIAEAFTKGNRLDVYDGTETSGEKYYNGLYECQFEMDTSTSSATKCKFCGKEKLQHINGGNK
jgi:hypothetical protein